MIGDLLLCGTLLMNAGAVLNFRLRQYQGVLTESQVLSNLHCFVEYLHDVLHDCVIWILKVTQKPVGRAVFIW